MSYERVLATRGWVDPKDLPKGPHGRPLCRWCGQETKPPRKTFCSDKCVHRFKLRSNPGYLRSMVWQRDVGVCAVCGIDTKVLRRKELLATYKNLTWYPSDMTPEAYHKELLVKDLKSGHGMGHLWQADHIKPVVEGGGGCGLRNMRTLCKKCHNEATKSLRKRLKKSTSGAK